MIKRYFILTVICLILFIFSLSVYAVDENSHVRNLGKELKLRWVIPFLGILLSIAIFPLSRPRFWHFHYGKIALFWALVMGIPFVFFYGKDAFFEILHIYLIDYIPFIILLGSLFVVSGGIVLKGKLKGTPLVNLIMLIIGTFLASIIGTTGSAMLMVRPVIRANAWRKHNVHVIVFFIFLVANIGGSLTPIGDPPLFLGFLHGVKFFWTTFNLLPHMLFTTAFLLTIFFILDYYYYKKEKEPEHHIKEKELRLEGSHNFLFLAGIITAVILSGSIRLGHIKLFGHIEVEIQNILKDIFLIFMGFLSWKTTSKNIRRANDYSWEPILEVAKLFASIFITIIPAIDILKAGKEGQLAPLMNLVNTPATYFWVSGILSSFLDNAPTYLTFFNTAIGSFYSTLTEKEAVALLMTEKKIFLQAISIGSVFMGANTYIGNAPNFMVKSMAKEAGIKMPSFFGYMFKYSFVYLIPTFILVTIIFF